MNFDEIDIKSKQIVKILEVVLDEELRMKQHISYAASKATTQCLAIKRMKSLVSKSMRQLYIAIVVSIIDYVAFI